MKIEFEGRTWQIDELDITNKQAEKIRAHTGLSMQKWFESLGDTDAEAWESSFDALYWAMLQQNPEMAAEIGCTGTAISDVDYAVYRFMAAYEVAYAAENPATEAEADPTRLPEASAPSPESSTRKAKTGASGPAGEVKPDG